MIHARITRPMTSTRLCENRTEVRDGCVPFVCIVYGGVYVAIFLIAIGLLFTSVDYFMGSGILYPAFIQPKGLYHGVDIHPKIQEYVTQNILGGQMQVDLLPDVIGCLLILLGAIMLMKHDKKFFQGVILAVAAGGLSVALRIVPFFVNGGAQIISVLSLFFLSVVFEIWMEYKVIYMTVNVSDAMANVSTNRRMQLCWWVSVFARIFIFLLTFAGIHSVRRVYEAVVLIFTLLYLYQLLQTRKYVGTYKAYKEGFNSAMLPEYIKEKMIGVSYRDNPDISLNELRYVRIIHYDFQGQIQEGELVVNQKIAYPVMRAFYQLYKWEYPIESVRLIDDYEGDDEQSMEANNSSAFNYRTIEGRTELSKHALGMAVDINPRMNPYVRKDEYFPKNATEYLERDPGKCTGVHRDKMIHKNDMAYKIFKRNGFSWGGDWTDSKDYQHFER